MVNGQPTRLTQWFIGLPVAVQVATAVFAIAGAGFAFRDYVLVVPRVRQLEAQQAQAAREWDVLLRMSCSIVRQVAPNEEPTECGMIFRNSPGRRTP